MLIVKRFGLGVGAWNDRIDDASDKVLEKSNGVLRHKPAKHGNNCAQADHDDGSDTPNVGLFKKRGVFDRAKIGIKRDISDHRRDY